MRAGYGERSFEFQKAVTELRALDGPDWPETLDYLHRWFYELHVTRGHDMNGPQSFTYPMVESWARLTGRSPDVHEVRALFAMDATYRSEAIKARAPSEPAKKKPGAL